MADKIDLARLAVGIADVLVVRIDRDETIGDINDHGCRTLGYDKAEIIGKNWFDTFVSEQVGKEIRPFFQDIMRGASPPEFYESPVLTRDGRQRFMRWHAVVLRDAKNAITGIVTSGEDVSDRARAEEALRESEKRYRSLFENMLDGYAYHQMIFENGEPRDYVFLAVNSAFERLTGLKNVVGKRVTEVITGFRESNPELFQAYGRVASTGQPDRFETYVEPLRAWFSVSVFSTEKGYFVTVFDNITARKKAEEELSNYRGRLETVIAERTAQFAQANAKLEQEIEEHKKTEAGLSLRASILDNAREAIFLLNPDGDFAYSNEAAIQTYGYTRGEFLSMNLRQLLTPEMAPVIAARLKEVFRVGSLELEATHLRKDGSPIVVQVRHNLIRTRHGQFIVSVMRDITEHRREEDNLKSGVAAFRSLVEHIPGVLLTVDSGLKLTLAVGVGLAALGVSADEAVGMPLAEFLKRSGLGEEVLAAARQSLTGGASAYGVEHARLKQRYSASTAALHDANGAIVGAVTVLLP